MNYFHVLLAALPFVAYLAVRWFLTENHALAARRKNAAQLAGQLKTWGLSIIPDFLFCYSTNDLEGMFADIERVAQIFAQSPSAILEEFDQVFENVLAAKLQSAAGRAFVQAKLTAANLTPPTS